MELADLDAVVDELAVQGPEGETRLRASAELTTTGVAGLSTHKPRAADRSENVGRGGLVVLFRLDVAAD